MVEGRYSIEQLRYARKWLGWSRHTLALRSGLDRRALDHMDTDKWNPTAKTMGKLEAAIRRAQTPVEQLDLGVDPVSGVLPLAEA